MARIIEMNKPNKAKLKSLATILNTFGKGCPRLMPFPIMLIPISLPANKPRNTHVVLIGTVLIVSLYTKSME